ncbi:MAG: C40 family peptidase [Pseudonocardiales bacterium]|nr:C40 family peptidase [Pseudonocardiales bacterium]
MIGLPVAVGGVVLLAIGGGVIAGGGCGGDGGAGGGSQQLGDRVWSAEQMTNSQTITQVTQSRRLPRRAAVLAVATAIVESDLVNVRYGDRDSLGLFQQRPSQGWGGPVDILNPAVATGKFLDRLVAIPGWSFLLPGVAEQLVQRSARPERYAPQEVSAAELVGTFWTGPDNPFLPPTGHLSTDQRATLAAFTASTGCGDQGGSTIRLDSQRLLPGFALPADPRQRAAVSYALAQVGKPYVWGAKGPEAFDCSGLVQAAWAAAGVAISAGTTSQVHDGTPVASLRQVQPGDLLFTPGRGTARYPGHVGLYAGAGIVVNAYDEHHGVILESLSAWAPHLVAIRHIAGPITPPRSPQP